MSFFSSFFSVGRNGGRPVRAAFSLVLATMILGVVGGCDAVNVHSDASSDSSPASFDEADLLYEPVSLASGDFFSIELRDDQFEQPAARIVHEGTADGTGSGPALRPCSRPR